MTLSLTPMQTPEPLRHTRRDARRGDRTVALVREEFETLHSYLKALSPADWQHETACAEWDVSEVVAHLGWGAQLYTEWITRGLAGDSSTPTGAWEAGSVSGAEAAPSVAESAQAFRASLGDTVLATFRENTAGLLDLFHGLDAQDWEKPCYHPGAIYPVSTFLSLRMMELSLHGWDIRSQLEPSARLSPASMQFIVELLPIFWCGCSVRATACRGRCGIDSICTESCRVNTTLSFRGIKQAWNRQARPIQTLKSGAKPKASSA